MATDYPTTDTPIVDAASTVKEAIWQATSRAWNENRSTSSDLSGAERYVSAFRALMALETPAKTLLANLQDHDSDQGVVLNDEARELASRVLSSVPRAVADLTEVDDGITEIFYPGLSDEVTAAMGADANVSFYISRLLNNVDAIEARADAAEHRQDPPLDDPFGDEETRRRAWATLAWATMSPMQREQREAEDRLFQIMREHPRLDITRLEERFHIEGTMSSDLVTELESLLSVLAQVRSQLVTVIKDNWSLRDLVERPQARTVEVTVGDVFANVSNSMIATRGARIERAVNNVSPTVAPEVADALKAIGEQIAKANDSAAVSDFESLTRELTEPKLDKSRLRARWDALVSVLPGILSLTEAVAEITALF